MDNYELGAAARSFALRLLCSLCTKVCTNISKSRQLSSLTNRHSCLHSKQDAAFLTPFDTYHAVNSWCPACILLGKFARAPVTTNSSVDASRFSDIIRVERSVVCRRHGRAYIHPTPCLSSVCSVIQLLGQTTDHHFLRDPHVASSPSLLTWRPRPTFVWYRSWDALA